MHQNRPKACELGSLRQVLLSKAAVAETLTGFSRLLLVPQSAVDGDVNHVDRIFELA